VNKAKRSTRHKRSICLATMLVLLAMRAAAADAPAGSMSIAEARGVVDQAIDLISRNYVFPEARPTIVAKLKADLAAGHYDVTNAGELAGRLSPDLAAAGNDKHLWIKYDPAQAASLLHGHKSQGARDYEAREGQLHHEGYESQRILTGNVRYIDVTGFLWNGAATTRAIGDAMRFAHDGDAVIIDLRSNPGGSAEAVQALVSYFLPPDHRLLMTFHDGANGRGFDTRVIDKLPAPRLVGKPLYVLISGDTASAAEEFAYHVRQFKLGTLVGGTTAGAANNDSLYPVGGGFVLSVSTGRPEHPVGHGNWQGTGIAPDVAAPVADALDAAHLTAVQALDARPGADHARYAWTLDGLRGRMHPPSLEPQALTEYTGTFGVRTIKLGSGALVFQRESRAPTTLSPLATDLFAFGNTEDVRLRFRRAGGRVTGFDLITVDGQTIAVDRSA
jgi:Peptidase family S41/N-terminal domain of Peptidase_S41 in eukaryotic IRBP